MLRRTRSVRLLCLSVAPLPGGEQAADMVVHQLMVIGLEQGRALAAPLAGFLGRFCNYTTSNSYYCAIR